jgi:DNA-binding GntR family transcriptional regulator
MTKSTELTPPAAVSTRRRREESISEQIKDMIIERKLMPGDRLRGERELMELFAYRPRRWRFPE